MIKKEDIKVGLRFYITRNDCLKCNFDPICVHDNTPILFSIDRKDGVTWLCTSVSFDKLYAYFATDSIMRYGQKFDIVTKYELETENGKSEQVSHPSHYAWLKDLCGVEPLDICRHLDFIIQGMLSSISCARIRWMATKQRPRSASRTCVRRCSISRTR